MSIFPELKNDSVAVMWAEATTGHVLDKEFKLRVSDDQEIYSVFDTLEDAVTHARKVLNQKKDIECIIYGKNKEVLFFINPNL